MSIQLKDAWVLKRNGAWYRSDYSGYCSEVAGAGVYSEDHARDQCFGMEGVTAHKLTDVLARGDGGTVAQLILSELSGR